MKTQVTPRTRTSRDYFAEGTVSRRSQLGCDRIFKCEACEADQIPKARRPTAIPRSYRLNHVVGLDLVMVKNLAGAMEFWLNCICWGTNFQLLGHVGPSKDAQSTWNCFVSTWIRFFGVPEIVVVDPGKEFEGTFGENVWQRGCAFLPTDARTPWQNGETERAGKEWKRTFKKAMRKEQPLNKRNSLPLVSKCALAVIDATTD